MYDRSKNTIHINFVPLDQREKIIQSYKPVCFGCLQGMKTVTSSCWEKGLLASIHNTGWTHKVGAVHFLLLSYGLVQIWPQYQLWLYMNILSIHSSIHWVTLYITEQSTGPSIYFQCHQYTAAAATVKSFAYLLTRISTHTATCGSVIFHPKFHTSGTQSFLYNLKNDKFYTRHHLIMAKTPYVMNTSTLTVLWAIC